MNKKKIEEIQKYLDDHPVELFWDCRDGLSKEQVTLLLEGKVVEVQDGIWEDNIDYICDLEWDAIKWAAYHVWPGLDSSLDIDGLVSKLREYVNVTIDMDLERLVRNTSAYICVELPVEHDSYWRDYSDVRDELEFFGINPAELREFFPDVRWYACQTRKNPILKTRDLVEAWVNCRYSGSWHAMLDAGEVLELAMKDKLHGKLRLKKGANIIIHDYWNGASSMNEPLLADIEVEAKEIYHDGASRYGIQSCCAFIDESWNGELEAM